MTLGDKLHRLAKLRPDQVHALEAIVDYLLRRAWRSTTDPLVD
jgi:hypothetical protein